MPIKCVLVGLKMYITLQRTRASSIHFFKNRILIFSATYVLTDMKDFCPASHHLLKSFGLFISV